MYLDKLWMSRLEESRKKVGRFSSTILHNSFYQMLNCGSSFLHMMLKVYSYTEGLLLYYVYPK